MEHFKRTDRVNDELKRLLGDLLEREVQDPRVGFVTVLDVEVARDFSVATVYVTLPEDQDTEETMAGLKAAAGFLRKRVGESMSLRLTPELLFVYDTSLDHGFRMDALFRKIAEERNDND
ncbi:30S ribosome-binding factor RbfA [Candidatus Zixiibacteriota bacterium]